MSFDVCIPLGPNDEDIIGKCVESVRKFVIGVKTIYVISSRPVDVSGAIVLQESLFPFSKEDVKAKVVEKRIGWYLQQLIKLYAPFVIPDCLPNCLIVDADVIFFKRVKFLDNGKFLFDKNHETHPPYFAHIKRLHPSFGPAFRNTSGIVNVMIVNKEILRELFQKVEDHHKQEFWNVFLDQVAPNEFSGASEYEIYFHYINKFHANKVILRPLRYSNFGLRSKIEGGDWHYVTYHHHVQKR
jgi:hypothetical protein